MRFFPALFTSIVIVLLATWLISSIFYPDYKPLEEIEESFEELERTERAPAQVAKPAIAREPVRITKTSEPEEIVEAIPESMVTLPSSFSGPKDFIAFYSLDGHAKDVKRQRDGFFSKGQFLKDRHGAKNGAYFNENPQGGIKISKPIKFRSAAVYSFSAWIYPSKFNVHNTIASQVTPSRDFNIKLMQNGTFQAHFARGAAYQFCTTDETIPKGKWTHVAATSDSRDWKLYVNGKFSKSCPIKFLPNGSSGSFYIGAMSGGENFSGLIDDVAIYDRTLTSEEIKRLFN